MDTSLLNILQEIANKTGIQIYGDSSLSNEKITAEFQNLTIEELLKKILGKYSFAFVFSSAEAAEAPEANEAPHRVSMIKEAWIFTSDKKSTSFSNLSIKGRDALPAAPAANEKAEPDKSNKLRQLEALKEKQDPSNIPVLLNFLKDPDTAISHAAMDILSNFGPLSPVEQIVDIAFNHNDPEMRSELLGMGFDISYEKMVDHVLHDPSPQVRLEALQLLEGNENIEEVARHALNDPDPSVQDAAREILKRISEENAIISTDEDESILMLEGAEH